MTKQSQPTPSAESVIEDLDDWRTGPHIAYEPSINEQWCVARRETLGEAARMIEKDEAVLADLLYELECKDKVIEQQAAELVAERMARAVLRNTIEQQASALKAVEADRVEIARLRGIEERLYAWCDKWGKTVYRKSSADDILRILEGDGKVSEPDACHEEMQ